MSDDLKDLEDFRLTLRQWLAENLPGDWKARMLGASEEQHVAFQKFWFNRLSAGGYVAPEPGALPRPPLPAGASASLADAALTHVPAGQRRPDSDGAKSASIPRGTEGGAGSRRFSEILGDSGGSSPSLLEQISTRRRLQAPPGRARSLE